MVQDVGDIGARAGADAIVSSAAYSDGSPSTLTAQRRFTSSTEVGDRSTEPSCRFRNRHESAMHAGGEPHSSEHLQARGRCAPKPLKFGSPASPR
jgi:hypothetical protein